MQQLSERCWTTASSVTVTGLTLNNYPDQTVYLGGTWSHRISFQWYLSPAPRRRSHLTPRNPVNPPSPPPVTLSCLILPAHHLFCILSKFIYFPLQINLIRKKAGGENMSLLLSSSISHSLSGSLHTDWLHGKWSGNFPFCSRPFMFQTHAHWGNDVHVGGGKQLTGLCFPPIPCCGEKRKERDAEIEIRRDRG